MTVVFPEKKVKNPTTGKVETRPEESREIRSEQVCCLSDIPAAHLGYHATRYGRFAVGFHRDAAVRHGFNPVFYSLDTTGVVRSMYEGFSQLEFVDPSDISAALDSITSDLDDLKPEIEVDISSSLMEIESEVSDLEDSVASANASLREFVAFVKTFRSSEFDSIYCEREWRALKPFSFDVSDIAMIVVPRVIGRRRYFDDFVDRVVPAIGLPRGVPIVPWEDLVEH